MWEKTAIKAFCSPYADVCEALSNAYYSENENPESEKSNIQDVAITVIDSAIENLNTDYTLDEIKKDIIEEAPEKPEKLKPTPVKKYREGENKKPEPKKTENISEKTLPVLLISITRSKSPVL